MPDFVVLRQRINSICIPLIMLASYFGAFSFGWQGVAAEISARERLAEALKLTHHAMELKFLAADFNGWQTTYAFDVVRNTPGAVEDDSKIREIFLKSATDFRDKLGDMPRELLARNEVENLDKAKRAFDEFMRVDEQVISAYRQGGAENEQVASQLVLGLEIDKFQEISNIISNLAASILKRSDQASKEASLASSSSNGLFIGGVLPHSPYCLSVFCWWCDLFRKNRINNPPQIIIDQSV